LIPIKASRPAAAATKFRFILESYGKGMVCDLPLHGRQVSPQASPHKSPARKSVARTPNAINSKAK
jgi:hypothetical protein